MLFGEKYHRWIYFLALWMMAAGMSMSKFMLGTSIFTLLINWFVESTYTPKVSYYYPRPQWKMLGEMLIKGNLRPKWELFKTRRSILVFIIFFLIHFIGIIWSPDANEAWKDIRIKLPLLLVPIAIGTTRPLEKKIFESVLIVFTAAVFVSTFSTILVAKGIVQAKVPITDIREASRFVPLIRLSLMVVMSVFLLGRWMIRSKQILSKAVCLVTMIWFSWFLLYMQSLTGLVIIFAGGLILIVAMSFIYRQKKLVYLILFLFAAGITTGTYFVRRAYTDFYTIHRIDPKTLEKYSPHGKLYTHKLDYAMVENGYPVMTYICWNELDSAWNTRSKIVFNGGKDAYGNPITMTLLRYMSSKGWRKDADAFGKLTDEEIRAVENGATNVLDNQRSPIEKRLYQVFWELYHYQHGANPSGNSVTMRLELLGTAIDCIREKPLIGVGTGGQKKAFENTYDTEGTTLGEEWQHLHAHNQFLSVGVTLGIPAMLFFIFMLWYAPSSMRRWRSYLYLAFFVTVTLSFLDDDTLETSQGVLFFIFFNSLFLYAMPRASAVREKPEKTDPVQL